VLVDDIGYGLSIGRGSGSTTVYSVVDVCELVGDSVGLCVGSDGVSLRWRQEGIVMS
jgi:hypothetical protein